MQGPRLSAIEAGSPCLGFDALPPPPDRRPRSCAFAAKLRSGQTEGGVAGTYGVLAIGWR